MDASFLWGLGLGAFGATVFLYLVACAYWAGRKNGASK
jgi:hypothetical protein